MSERNLGRVTLFAFCLPALMQGFMHAPAQSIIQGVYARDTGLTLAALGGAVFLTRLFDAITDPLIGLASDAWYRRTGSRKHFVAFGTVVTLLGLWFLYRPPADVTITYFTAWFLVVYLGWTITEIPYRAWSFELSSDYSTRTTIQTWVSMALMIGAFSFYGIPYLARAVGQSESTQIGVGTLAFGATIIVVVMPLVNGLALWRVPNGSAGPIAGRPSAREVARAILGNRPLLYFIGMFLLSGLTTGMAQGISFLYIDTFLGLGEQYAVIVLAVAPLAVLGVGFWGWMCQRFERQKVWAAAQATTALFYGIYGAIPVGEDGANALAITLLFGGIVFFGSVIYPAALSMLGDISDYARWKFNQDHAGTYLSCYTLIQKSVIGLGIAFGYLLLSQLGFDATSATQTSSGEIGIRLVAAWAPAAGMILVTPFLWFFPITRASHAAMIAEIERREAGEPAPSMRGT